jgi:DNA polymerase III alpha subunit (gram-positive type)
MHKIFVFDLETTGLGEMGEAIVPVQIAGIILDARQPGFPEIDCFHEFLKIPSYAHVEPYAMQMHEQKGRSYEWFMNAGKPPLQVYQELDAFIRKHGNYLTPAGHNAAGYDMPILRREVKRWLGIKHKLPLDYHVMDTMSYALFDMKFANNQVQKVKLEMLCQYLGIELSKEAAHDALNDVRATAACLRKMVDTCRARYAALGR